MPTVKITISPLDNYALVIDEEEVARGAGNYSGAHDLSAGKHVVEWQGTGAGGAYQVTFDGASPASTTRRFVGGRAAGEQPITVDAGEDGFLHEPGEPGKKARRAARPKAAKRAAKKGGKKAAPKKGGKKAAQKKRVAKGRAKKGSKRPRGRSA